MLELPGKGEALMEELHRLVMAEALAGVEPRPGALELLEQLVKAGVPVAVASNSQREFVQRTLSGAGLLDGRFQTVVSVEDVEHPKPAPDIYLEACRRLGAEPERCAALEDSATGVAAAKAAGMYVIGVPYFAGGELSGGDLLVDSLADPAVAASARVGVDLVPGQKPLGTVPLVEWTSERAGGGNPPMRVANVLPEERRGQAVTWANVSGEIRTHDVDRPCATSIPGDGCADWHVAIGSADPTARIASRAPRRVRIDGRLGVVLHRRGRSARCASPWRGRCLGNRPRPVGTCCAERGSRRRS